MKVLLCTRYDYLKKFGGDSIIIKYLYIYLKKLGVDVTINNGDIYSFNDYDIIHLFNINALGEMYKYYKQACKFKSKIVVSPLYFDMKYYYKYNKEDEKIKLWNSANLYREEILKKSDLIICNSNWELNKLKENLKFDTNYKIIYNGAYLLEDEDVPLYNFVKKYNLNDYVLSVGKINKRKNQLELCKICNELNYNLVLIGPVGDIHYLKQCLSYKNVRYLGIVDNYNLFNAYKFAKVYALPSYMEITNLSALEAAASGCNIVVTEEGASKEYFKDFAIYCNPYNKDSIKESLIKGYNKKKNDKLKNFVIEKYSWEDSAKILYEEYLKLIEFK